MKANLVFQLFPVILALQINGLFAQQFTNVAEALGVVHSMSSADGFGGGASFCDFDQDGWDDITLVNENDSLYFFRNVGGQFERIFYAGVFSGKVRQALWVDYDNDGHLDLFVSRDGSACLLFRNNGNMTFQDVTVEAGIAGLNTRNYGVSFADYNKDGFLDFYLARYLIFGDITNEQHVNALFKNNGDGTFTNVTFEAGVSNGSQLSFMGGWMDYNNDGWPDLMVINDKLANHNHLYHNNGDGTFTDVTESTGAHMPLTDAMSATFADFDSDGDLDFYSTSTHHLSAHPKLLVNQAGEYFTEEATERGVNFNQWSWGAAFFDADNDSNLDLYIASGWTSGHWNPEVPSALFMNDGDHTFTNQTFSSFEQSTVAASYGVALGDIDNDGYADILSLNADNYNSFLWKNAGGAQSYIKVTLEGTVSNRMAIGSWISVYASGEKFVHYTRCGENYCSQNSQHHIFGLANADIVDSIAVNFPSGHTDNYYNLSVNLHYTFTEGETYSAALQNNYPIALCTGDSTWIFADEHYEYLWNTGDTTQSIVVQETGIYYFTAWNESGLPAFSDTVEVTMVPELEGQIEVQHVSCFGAQDGSLTAQISLGSMQQILWNTGDTDTLIQQLGPGLYSFVAIDQFGCEVSAEISINEPAPIVTQALTSDVLCYGDATGTAQINVFGGTPPYSIDWDGWNPQYLAAGNYVATITDNNACVHYADFYINQPDSLWLLLQSTNAGIPENSGTATLEIFGGTPPYSITWSNGAINEYAISELSPGEYSVWVSDGQQCTNSLNFSIEIDLETSIHQLGSEDIQIFPNPTRGMLQIAGTRQLLIDVKLTDSNGRVLMHKKNHSVAHVIDLPDLASGWYLLEITDGQKQSIHRLIAEH